MVIQELIRETVETLRLSHIENSVFDANLMVRTVLGLSPIDMVLSHQKKADKKQIEVIRDYTKRRCGGEPLQYILGVQEFMGLEFAVSQDVLIPRADTETLVETALEEKRGMNILDICTGSGCVALSIAHFNKNAFVCGIDISEKALQVAEQNAQNLALTDRVRFLCMDIMKESPKGTYDMIVSNPPYIESDVIDGLQKEVSVFEPHLALDGGADGLDFYRRIANIAPVLLQEGGQLIFEVGFEQADQVAALLEKDFKRIEKRKDLCGVERVVKAVK